MKKILFGVLACIMTFSGCVDKMEDTVGKPVGHIVIIGLDGWGSYSFERADMPVTKRLVRKGAFTLSTRSVLPSSSACNWASMFMGAGPELHGYTTWGSRTPDLPPRVTDRYGFFPSMFSLLFDQREGVKIGMMYEWDGIGYLCPKEVLHTDRQVPAVDGRSDELAKAAVEYILSDKPDLLVIAFDEPDGAGHKFGHDTQEYYAKLAELDGYIGLIEQALKQAGIYDDTVIIVTADHGGTGTGHGGITMEEMQVPFIITGPGIREGHTIETSTMMYDTAATVAWLLGLDMPQVWTGRPITEIAE